MKRFSSVRGLGQVLSVTAALIVMVIIFGVINPRFFSVGNITNLLRQVAPILIIGIGQSCVLLTAGIDLSIGSVAGMSSMISATLMTAGAMKPLSAALVAIACSLLIGVINGLLISATKLPAFIATLGTMIIARGVAQLVNGNMNTDGIKYDGFKSLFYYGKFIGIYNPIWLAAILFAVFAIILSKTRTGRHIYAVGSNYEATRLSGVNVIAAQVKVYVFSSLLAGIVGLILTAQSGMGSMDAGSGYELNAVAASVIGGVSTMGGQGMLLGTVIGSFIWGVLNNGLQFAGAPLALRNLVIGVVVIISVLIDRVVRGRRRKVAPSVKNSDRPESKQTNIS